MFVVSSPKGAAVRLVADIDVLVPKSDTSICDA
jgi:hypothetical protein